MVVTCTYGSGVSGRHQSRLPNGLQALKKKKKLGSCKCSASETPARFRSLWLISPHYFPPKQLRLQSRKQPRNATPLWLRRYFVQEVFWWGGGNYEISCSLNVLAWSYGMWAYLCCLLLAVVFVESQLKRALQLLCGNLTLVYQQWFFQPRSVNYPICMLLVLLRDHTETTTS